MTALVSVVIATRNRAPKLGRLLQCVREQDIVDFECLVSDDGSSEETRNQYPLLWQQLDGRFRLLLRRHPGGPAQARNTGISAAAGRYVAFCDDDDYWTRKDHLSVAFRSMQTNGSDLFIANMQMSVNGIVENPDWYGDIFTKGNSPIAGETDVYPVSKRKVAAFLRHRIFSADTLVISRKLLNNIGSYWENIRFAEDHDFSFRLADGAKGILFRSTVAGDADVSPHPSIARSYSEQDRILFGALATLHAEASINDPVLRKVARGNRAWRLLELARLSMAERQYAIAQGFVLQALGLSPSKEALKILLQVGGQRLLR